MPTLSTSVFRRRFRLGPRERAYLAQKGLLTVLEHGRDFILQRLAPAKPRNDGKQTPFRGHMKLHWPEFDGRKLGDGMLHLNGPLKPKARLYHVAIFWKPGTMALPYVWLYDPALQPRAGGAFADIPHLIFYKENPEHSGLCLFDPDGKEWSPSDLIAETTVPWATEWLLYYELWHLTGEWLASGVGRERVAQLPPCESSLIKDILADVH